MNQSQASNPTPSHQGRRSTRYASSETGATGVEYAIIGSLIAAVIVLVVTALGLGVNDLFGSLSW